MKKEFAVASQILEGLHGIAMQSGLLFSGLCFISSSLVFSIASLFYIVLRGLKAYGACLLSGHFDSNVRRTLNHKPSSLTSERRNYKAKGDVGPVHPGFW